MDVRKKYNSTEKGKENIRTIPDDELTEEMREASRRGVQSLIETIDELNLGINAYNGHDEDM
ncbi:hypothetical protein ACFL56_02625 [Candidatus Margulisiibacteriota bacterium]